MAVFNSRGVRQRSLHRSGPPESSGPCRAPRISCHFCYAKPKRPSVTGFNRASAVHQATAIAPTSLSIPRAVSAKCVNWRVEGPQQSQAGPEVSRITARTLPSPMRDVILAPILMAVTGHSARPTVVFPARFFAGSLSAGSLPIGSGRLSSSASSLHRATVFQPLRTIRRQGAGDGGVAFLQFGGGEHVFPAAIGTLVNE